MDINNGIIIQTYKNNWGSQGGITMAANKTGQKTLTWPVAWPHYGSVSWVGIVNGPGVTISTSSLTSTTITFSLYNCTNNERTIDRCNIIAIGY